MTLSTPLGKEESIINEYVFSYSLPLFFLKSNFHVTNKRLIVDFPNVFLFFPTGSDTVTYPLRSITGVATKKQVKIFSLFLGVTFFLIGASAMSELGFLGLLFLLLGIFFLLGAIRTVIAVASGGVVAYSCLPWESEKAKKMINELNQLIVDI